MIILLLLLLLLLLFLIFHFLILFRGGYEYEKVNIGIRRKVGSKMSFRPKNREDKELRGESGAFDTETSWFGGDVSGRSA